LTWSEIGAEIQPFRGLAPEAREAHAALRDHNMLTATKPESLVIETDEARERAKALLDDLLRVRAETESRLEESSRSDPMSVVTGRSSLDNAIERTERMLALLERASEALRSGWADSLTPEERELLSEIDEELGPTG